jgi:hypothetical protein
MLSAHPWQDNFPDTGECGTARTERFDRTNSVKVMPVAVTRKSERERV